MHINRTCCLPSLAYRVVCLIAFITLSGLSTIESPTASEGDLVVEIVPFPPGISSDEIIIRFSNHGSKPIIILKPLDGSRDGRTMPSYQFKITDTRGRSLKKPGIVCGIYGLWANTKWPDDYVVEIEPGGIWEIAQSVPFTIPRLAEYRINFEYAYDSKAWHWANYSPAKKTWEGTVRAPEISTTLCSYQFIEVGSDEELIEIDNLDEITSVQASGDGFTDTGLKQLNDMPRLRYLDLSNTGVSDEGLKNLSSLVNLNNLDLSCTNAGDRSLQHLEKLNRLVSLDLSRTLITNKGLKHLVNLKGLRTLVLSGTFIDDDSMTHISKMVGLEQLWLNSTNVTDSGIKQLAKLSHLQWIGISGTNITAQGIITLSHLKRFENLSAHSGQLSSDDKELLKTVMPNLVIYDR